MIVIGRWRPEVIMMIMMMMIDKSNLHTYHDDRELRKSFFWFQAGRYEMRECHFRALEQHAPQGDQTLKTLPRHFDSWTLIFMPVGGGINGTLLCFSPVIIIILHDTCTIHSFDCTSLNILPW
jgi:hypothetical protein